MIYRPLIESMTWSNSRLDSFGQCPFAWFQKYINEELPERKFYSDYGSFMHRILANYYLGYIKREDLVTEFLIGFRENVSGERPSASVVDKYIDDGVSYLSDMTDFPFKTIGVEKKIEFDIDGAKMVGFIDYIGEDDNGNIVIVDHKSRALKNTNSKRATGNDVDIGHVLRQLYVYASGVKREYGRLPSLLFINAFRSKTLMKLPFRQCEYDSMRRWVSETIERIESEEDFPAEVDWFRCKWICDVSSSCPYWQDAQYGRGHLR